MSVSAPGTGTSARASAAAPLTRDLRRSARRLAGIGVIVMLAGAAVLAPAQPTVGTDAQAGGAGAGAGTPPPNAAHASPAPPAHGAQAHDAVDAMPAAQMREIMGMDDDASFGRFVLDRFERVDADAGFATAWDAYAWFGRDFDKLWFRSEGERRAGTIERADAELLWSHAAAAFWDLALGVRDDFGRGPDRRWAAFGVQGLAPYWLDVQATAYVGEQGRTALRFESEYELRLTRRLVLQPRFELNAYGKADPARRLGAGVSDAELGLRLRYEIRRELAPYVGVEWRRRFGATAAYARAAGDDAFDAELVAGLRLWF
ncbi:MAG TPA: copper resistance protein B [Dokdonella sp.]